MNAENLLKQKNYLYKFTMSFIFLVIIFALFIPFLPLASYGQEIKLSSLLSAPSWLHPFGTDGLGRDLLVRIIWGGRTSLLVGVLSRLMALGIGILLGGIAGYWGGKVDVLIMRVVDIFLAFPALLLVMILATVMAPGFFSLSLALGLASWATVARLVRGQILALRENEYVMAAQAIGLSQTRCLFFHILPNCLSPLIVWGSMSLATAIMAEAGLSFIGLGVPPGTASWGIMIAEGADYIGQAYWVILFPGLALALTVFSFNLLGDLLRDKLTPSPS